MTNQLEIIYNNILVYTWESQISCTRRL